MTDNIGGFENYAYTYDMHLRARENEMTDDKLERLRTACEGKRDITLPALEVLNMVDMIQSYGAEIDRLYEQGSCWTPDTPTK